MSIVYVGMESALKCDPAQLSDSDLADRLKTLVGEEKTRLADILRHLLEFERRRLSQTYGFPSLYVYCTQTLGFGAGTAYRRIRVVRAARRWPEVIDWIENGDMTVESIALLSGYLDDERGLALLNAARGKSSREVEYLIAALFPRPEVKDCIQAMSRQAGPDGANLSSVPATSPGERDDRGRAEPLSADRIHFSFTGSRELMQKLERVRELVRHKYPVGRLEDVVLEAVEVFLDHRDPDRRELAREREDTGVERRRIPQWVKDKVWKRDQGMCSFIGVDGRRCEERGWLEYDHLMPYTLGGRSNDPKNIRLLCRAHNQYTARDVFGNPPTRPPTQLRPP